MGKCDQTRQPGAVAALARAAPRGLVVERLELNGDELAVLAWDAEADPDDVGRRALTAAESRVLELVIAGASNAAIAARRGVSARTVANQVASLLRKLAAGSRYDLIRRYGGSRGG